MRKTALDMFGQRASRVSPKSTGFAGIPGTGQNGETCRTCQFTHRWEYCDGVKYYCTKGFESKTQVMQHRKPINTRASACSFWSKK
jgi:hypothetical protein